MNNTLDYASPHEIAELPDENAWQTVRRLWLVPAAVGVFFLVAFTLTRLSPVALLGFFWLPVGGLISSAGVIAGLHYCYRAACAGFREPADRRRAALAVVLPLSNFPLAFACASIGIKMISAFGMRVPL